VAGGYPEPHDGFPDDAVPLTLKYTVVVDGREREACSGFADTESFRPVFSPDSSHVAYACSDGSRGFVVADGKKGPLYDGGVSTPTFSPNSRHLVYYAGKNGRSLVIIDGRTDTESDGASNPVFSPDGQHVAYAVKNGAKLAAVVDGHSGPTYDSIIKGPMIFDDNYALEYLTLKEHSLYRVRCKIWVALVDLLTMTAGHSFRVWQMYKASSPASAII
jgi:hypothetical protein